MIVPEDIAWTHRRGELGELYFVANQKDETRTFTASMRINGKKPECWNPVTGEMNIHPSYRINGNRTEVTLTLAPNESVFIVYPAEGVDEGYGESSLQLQKEKKDIAKAPLNIALEAKEYTITFVANKKRSHEKNSSTGAKNRMNRYVIIRGQRPIKPLFAGKINRIKTNRFI